ncbi:hypothetical protein N7510_007533 [Penicillium lagena]|uniref:uncharacterized protein n=1 Tax=Penicillium lagena TaxID=94218 RepID=UPI0025405EE5|nr:uncharacterized protein N7510_007533 [Penicillium lagena]KAJ5610814.1 hypothetical protein N7510_007533 [Penicillium lagena]
MRSAALTPLVALLGTLPAASATPRQHPSYVDWRTFRANGVNLGGWLEQESTIDTAWWAKYSGGASDEWGLCSHLGAQCGPVLEERYATFITTADIDKLAHAGVQMLRIPTTYAAWIKLPGSQLYSGRQQEYLRRIADYAIERHGMHIVVDIHSLPGGTNGLDIGEATGHWGWWWNETALDWSLRAVDALIDFVQTSPHPTAYTIEPINEPADNHDFSAFGTPDALSDHGADWLLRYIHAVLARAAAAAPGLPVMFQGSFKHEEYWSPHFEREANLVFDLHHYYFQYDNSTSANLPEFLCADARVSAGDGKFPTFVGEWAMEAGAANSLALRGRNLRAGLSAFEHFTQGSSYWTAKFWSNATVVGQGDKQDYWNYEEFIDAGYLDGRVVESGYCSE